MKALLAVALLLVSGCSAASSTPGAQASTAATPIESIPESIAAATCPYNDSPCLGPLAAGTYRTTPPPAGFWEPLEYTVPDGWDNIEDYPNAFDLRYSEYTVNGGWNGGGSTAGIAVFDDMGTAPSDAPCGEVSPAPLSVDEWMAVLVDDPDLAVSTPAPVMVGGLEGMAIDVGISPDYTGTCDFGGPVRSKGFIVQTGEPGVHRAFPEFPQRVIFLSVPNGHTVTILVEDRFPEDAYQAFLADQALPVIDSFRISAH